LSDILAVLAAAAPSLGGPAEIWASIVHDFSSIGTPAAMAAFLQVLMIDIVLAGDNAIVVGALAAGLPAEQRRKVIFLGVIAALVLRIAALLISVSTWPCSRKAIASVACGASGWAMSATT
jgi:predicted tellurium resistance membrane protein TerC